MVQLISPEAINEKKPATSDVLKSRKRISGSWIIAIREADAAHLAGVKMSIDAN